jgi:hypothetical protein
MNTIPVTYTGVIRALAWLEDELFICTEDEIIAEFERRYRCVFSADRQTVCFDDPKNRFWFKARWK